MSKQEWLQWTPEQRSCHLTEKLTELVAIQKAHIKTNFRIRRKVENEIFNIIEWEKRPT